MISPLWNKPVEFTLAKIKISDLVKGDLQSYVMLWCRVVHNFDSSNKNLQVHDVSS